MRSRRRWCGLLIMTAITCLACGRERDTPTGPSRPVDPTSALVGTWVGTIVEDSGASGTLELAIAEQVAISLTGAWTTTFGDASLDDRGRVTGSVQPTSIGLILESASRSCGPPAGPPLVVLTVRVDGDRMTGEYAGFSCGPLRGGRVELTKR